MSPVRLNGSTSGYSELSAPAVAGDQTFLLPSTSGTLDRLNRAGNILQVVSVAKTDIFTTTSTALVDITGLSVSIAPTSATSKILVLCSLSLNVTNGNYMAQAVLFRGATRISVGDAAGSRIQCSAYATVNGDRGRSPFSITFLDSPATTSSTTYKFQGLIESGGTLYINQNASDADSVINGRTASTITVMEVAA